jgi:hypothetical protein
VQIPFGEFSMRIVDLVRLLSGVLICLSCSPSILESQTTNLSSMGPPVGASAAHKRSDADIPRSFLGNLPLQFEENKGQAEGNTRFLARGLGYTLLLNPDGLELNLRPKGNRPTRHLSMHLLGAQASNLLGRDLTSTQTNYYLGRDPHNWHLGVRSYSSVVYEGVYKGIDLIYHGSGSQLEYDFVIAPGSDPAQIRMRFDGLKPLLQGKDLSFEAEDKLSVRTLKAFQILDGIKKPVDAEWEIVGDQASIHLGPYDHGHELIIDPIFFYGSYIAGTGADDAVSIVQGAQQGQFYVALSTSSTQITQPTNNTTVTNPNCNGTTCGTDTLILEIQATTTDIPVWIAPTSTDPTDWKPAPQDEHVNTPAYPSVLSASYLGGNAGDTKPTSMVADKTFNLYVTGSTTNPGGLPQLGSPICTQTCIGIGYVAKLSSNLTLTYSLALAAIGSGIGVDGTGNAYITGMATAGTIPQSDLTFQKLLTSGSALVSGNHAYLMELGPAGALLFSSLIGGSGVDGGKAVAVSGTGDTVYVTGSTTSTDFPTKCSACQTTFGGGSGNDVFVLAMSHLPAGPVLEYSTYLGGSGDDSSSSIAVDVAGNVVNELW